MTFFYCNIYNKEFMKDFNFNRKAYFEPRLKNRFVVELVGISVDSFLVNKVKRPVYDISSGWGDLSLEIMEVTSSSLCKEFFDIIESKLRDREIKISLVDATGVVLETWDIVGDYKVIDFGGCDYSCEEPLSIKIDFRVNSCILTVN
jgi:hypothetical protein